MKDLKYQKPIKKNNAFLTVLVVALIIFICVFLLFVIYNSYNKNTDWNNKMQFNEIETTIEYGNLHVIGNIENISDKNIRRIEIIFEFYSRANKKDVVEVKKQLYYLGPGEIKRFDIQIPDHEKEKIDKLKESKVKIKEVTYWL